MNRWFAVTDASRAFAVSRLAADWKRLARRGLSETGVAQLASRLIAGTTACLFNTPLDLVIESRLHRDAPVLRAAQFVSLHRLAEEAWAAVGSVEIRKDTPAGILRRMTALNGCSALFWDHLSGGATCFWPRYEKLDGSEFAQRLFEAWKGWRWEPGAEYGLVDEFAAILDMEGWFEWHKDPGTHEITESPAREGTTNPELLRTKHSAAVWFLLDALRRYETMPAERIREIAFEVALLGRSGLDYASSEKKYTLRSLPGESFSGLQLMCLMHAGFRRIQPDLDTGMDLEEPFLTALELFQKET